MSKFTGPLGLPPIVAVLFTYALGCYTVRYRDGTTEVFSPKRIFDS